jgi:hypothetical protein
MLKRPAGEDDPGAEHHGSSKKTKEKMGDGKQKCKHLLPGSAAQWRHQGHTPLRQSDSWDAQIIEHFDFRSECLGYHNGQDDVRQRCDGGYYCMLHCRFCPETRFEGFSHKFTHWKNPLACKSSGDEKRDGGLKKAPPFAHVFATQRSWHKFWRAVHELNDKVKSESDNEWVKDLAAKAHLFDNVRDSFSDAGLLSGDGPGADAEYGIIHKFEMASQLLEKYSGIRSKPKSRRKRQASEISASGDVPAGSAPRHSHVRNTAPMTAAGPSYEAPTTHDADIPAGSIIDTMYAAEEGSGGVCDGTLAGSANAARDKQVRTVIPPPPPPLTDAISQQPAEPSIPNGSLTCPPDNSASGSHDGVANVVAYNQSTVGSLDLMAFLENPDWDSGNVQAEQGTSSGGAAGGSSAQGQGPPASSLSHRPIFDMLLDAMARVHFRDQKDQEEWNNYDPDIDFEVGGEVELARVIGEYVIAGGLQSRVWDEFFDATHGHGRLYEHFRALRERPCSAATAISMSAIYIYWRVERELLCSSSLWRLLNRWQGDDIRGRLENISEALRQGSKGEEAVKQDLKAFFEQVHREIHRRLRDAIPRWSDCMLLRVLAVQARASRHAVLLMHRNAYTCMTWRIQDTSHSFHTRCKSPAHSK